MNYSSYSESHSWSEAHSPHRFQSNMTVNTFAGLIEEENHVYGDSSRHISVPIIGTADNSGTATRTLRCSNG
ncbi:hypothetical protein J6590_089796 [Homalodisca vitripennis]|nr:hypothetical protein J6590_089796 [Homalodisca vitripennis]